MGTISGWFSRAMGRIQKHPVLLVAILVSIGFVAFAYIFDWNWTGFPDKKLFNWLQILLIPAAVAIGTFFLNQEAKKRDNEAQQNRMEEDALQGYLDQLTNLLLIPKSPPSESPQGSVRAVTTARVEGETYWIIQSRTEILLRELQDPVRLFTLVAFLSKLGDLKGLLSGGYGLAGNKPAVSFRDADLRRVRGVLAFLPSFDLSGANLQEAVLRRADLSGADLTRANLQKADLGMANLQKANFTKADLRGANLYAADLQRAVLIGADLRGAYFEVKDLTLANVQSADFREVKDVNKQEVMQAKLTQLLTFAIGDVKTTKLPEGVQAPPSWNESIEVQTEIIEKNFPKGHPKIRPF